MLEMFAMRKYNPLKINKVNYMNIGKSIKYALIERDMRAQELAHKAGMSKSYLSQIANGHRQPGIDIVGTIAKSLDYSVSEFIALGE